MDVEEHSPEKAGVGGSIPSLATILVVQLLALASYPHPHHASESGGASSKKVSILPAGWKVPPSGRQPAVLEKKPVKTKLNATLAENKCVGLNQPERPDECGTALRCETD